MKRISNLLFILVFLVAQGCVTFYSREKQPLIVKTELPSGDIYQVDQLLGKDEVKTRVLKSDGVTQFIVKKDGYMDRNHSIVTSKKNPVRFGNLILLPTILGYAYAHVFDTWSPKKFQFEKMQTIAANVKSPSQRTEKQKYVFLNKTSLSIQKDDTTDISYDFYKDYQKKQNPKYTYNEKNKLKFGNTIFSDDLKALFHKYGYRDTTKTLFPNYTNTVYINTDIIDLKYTTIYPYQVTGNKMNKVKIVVNYELLDYYQQSLKKFTFTSESDFFVFNINRLTVNKDNDTNQNGYLRSLKNALEYSLVKLLADKDFLEISQLGTEDKAVAIETINIVKPATIQKRLNDLIKSAVTVKNGDSHGSGFIISQDGYIVSNLHVIANSDDKLQVILNNGEKLSAKVIRTSVKSDLALIKIEKASLPAMTVLDMELESEIGSNVSTIGSPKSVELGQSVSKGIISGIRNANNINYMQTDMSINGGNSGGAILTEDGLVIGIVTAKMVGIGIEGIGFGIPSHLIFKDLGVKYRK